MFIIFENCFEALIVILEIVICLLSIIRPFTKKHIRRNHIIDVCTFVHKTKSFLEPNAIIKLILMACWKLNIRCSFYLMYDWWFFNLFHLRCWCSWCFGYDLKIPINMKVSFQANKYFLLFSWFQFLKWFSNFTYLSRLDHEAFVLRYEYCWLKCD